MAADCAGLVGRTGGSARWGGRGLATGFSSRAGSDGSSGKDAGSIECNCAVGGGLGRSTTTAALTIALEATGS